VRTLTVQFSGTALLAVITAIMCGCSSAPLRVDHRFVTANLAGQSSAEAQPDVGANLPTPGGGTATSVVIPDSGFIDQPLDRVQSLPLPPLVQKFGTDIVVGQASDDRYRAGVGWVHENGGDNLKLSLFRQQTVGDELEGLWLASLQGKLTSIDLGDEFDLMGELAVATDGGSSHQIEGGSGIRLRLLRKPVDSFSYGLTLSQFSEGFQPYGSIVDAGERRAAANLGYRLWSGTQMTANADYILRDWEEGVPCDEYRTDLSLSSTVLAPLLAKLETSAQRVLDCDASSSPSNIDSWKLTLSEKTWTGWNLNLVAGMSEESRPFLDEQRTTSHYRLTGDRDLRLGPLWASFGPEVSLQTVTDDNVQRRLQTGFQMGIETRRQDFTLYLGYESLSDSAGAIEENFGKIKLNYRLAFGV